MQSGGFRDDGRDQLIGTDLGRFRVIEPLGAGGMGVVYRAVDNRLKRDVALKVLPQHLASDPDHLARFEREAEAVAALNHPSIVTIYSVEEHDGRHFLTMELVDGVSLHEQIPPGGMAIDELLRIACSLADALVAAHDRGIIHRDLKPTNIMVASNGLVKVLDFGLAKLFEAQSQEGGPEDDTVTELTPLTRVGAVVGTPGYMSPEQIRGTSVDHRTDIFSLGVVLYEMATGRKAFSGPTRADVQLAILRDEPEAVSRTRAEVPPHFGRIVRQCLQKKPELRPQTAIDLRNQLSGLRTELESERVMEKAGHTGAVPPPRRPSKWWGWTAAALAAVLLTAASGLLPWPGEQTADLFEPATPTAVGPTESSVLAVVPFRNLTDDPDLNWLRTGISELFVTSLLQTPGLEVLDSETTRQLLVPLELAPNAEPPMELLRLFAERAGVSRVLRGSYRKLGETVRIDAEVLDVATARVIGSADGAGEGDASLFSVIDLLSHEVLQQLDVAVAPDAGAASGLAQVTTASIEALRYYTEGLQLLTQVKRQESIVMFERALELDPGFAMASHRLGVAYANLGDDVRAREYAQRAFENSARASDHERAFIQGRYLSLAWDTYGEAVAALQRTIDRYPGHNSARNLLANRLAAVDDYTAAIPHLERLRVVDPTYGGNFWLLSTVYAAEGRFEDARSVVADFQRGNPENWYGHLLSGWLSLREGQLDEALAAFAVADRLRPGTNEVRELRWAAYIQGDRWPEAEAAARAQAASDDPYYQWIGNVYLARTALYQGRSDAALAAFVESRAPFGTPGSFSGLSRVWAADLRLLRSEAQQALDEAAAAQSEGAMQWPELRGIYLSGLAAEALGQGDNADRALEELEGRNADRNAVETRQALHLEGRLALSRGATDVALARLTAAAALLPPHGLYNLDRFRLLPDHVPIWYSLATALRAAGRDADAAGWFAKIVDQRLESRNEPVRYARSVYQLAELQDHLGREQEALALYRRFVDLWSDGDLDREQVAAARARLAG